MTEIAEIGAPPATTVAYRIDEDDVIVETAGAWDDFADANGGVPAVVGRPLWQFVAGADVQAVWQLLLRRVRATEESLAFLYRCDAPGITRLLQMELLPEPGGAIEFRSSQVRVLPGTTFDGRWEPGTAHETTTVCGWCARVSVDEGWWSPDAAIERLGLAAGAYPRLSHGICTSCESELRSLARSV
jgi:hypothetical protein